MSFHVSFNEATGIIESRVHQVFDWNLIESMIPVLGKFVLEKGSNLLFIDFRDATVGMSTMKIYETPKKIGSEFAKIGIDVHGLKRAVLIQSNQKDFHFLEDVTINNAQVLKVFTTEESAVEWLLAFKDK